MSGVVTTEPLVGALPGTIVKHARGLTNASRYSQSGSTWGGGRNRPLPSASRLCAEVWGQVGEGAADPQLRTPGQATMTPQGRSSSRLSARSVDHHGSVGKVRRERCWNTTSVSRETTGRFGIAAWKRGLMPLHERRCVLRCLCWLTPETMNNHPTPLFEQSLGSEEIRYRQVLVLPRFHVKHGKWRFHPYRCVARPYRSVAVLVDVVLRRR